MKILRYFIVGLFLLSCGEGLNQSPIAIDTIERLNFSTYSVNAYSPEFVNESNDNVIEVKVIKDSTKVSPKRNIFQGIIKKLNLDSTQRVAANILLIKHEECIKSCLTSVKLEEKKIIDSSKAIRDSILKSLDLGLISRLEVRKKMAELNKSTKEKLMSLNERFKVKDCMESCDKEFIASFSTLLTPEQLKTFNEWLFLNRLGKDKKKG